MLSATFVTVTVTDTCITKPLGINFHLLPYKHTMCLRGGP